MFKAPIVVTLALAFSPFLVAQSTEDRVLPEINEANQQEHVKRLSSNYGISEELVEQARLAGIGIGEIDVLADMAKATGKPVSDIIALKQRGMTWAAIASEHHLRIEDIVKDEDSRAAVIDGERNLGRELAQEYGITEAAASSYRVRLAEWGEVKLALGMAKASGTPVETIVARAEKGEGWGDIATDLNLNIGTIMRDPDAPENDTAGAAKPPETTPRERRTKD